MNALLEMILDIFQLETTSRLAKKSADSMQAPGAKVSKEAAKSGDAQQANHAAEPASPNPPGSS